MSTDKWKWYRIQTEKQNSQCNKIGGEVVIPSFLTFFFFVKLIGKIEFARLVHVLSKLTQIRTIAYTFRNQQKYFCHEPTWRKKKTTTNKKKKTEAKKWEKSWMSRRKKNRWWFYAGRIVDAFCLGTVQNVFTHNHIKLNFVQHPE